MVSRTMDDYSVGINIGKGAFELDLLHNFTNPVYVDIEAGINKTMEVVGENPDKLVKYAKLGLIQVTPDCSVKYVKFCIKGVSDAFYIDVEQHADSRDNYAAWKDFLQNHHDEVYKVLMDSVLLEQADYISTIVKTTSESSKVVLTCYIDQWMLKMSCEGIIKEVNEDMFLKHYIKETSIVGVYYFDGKTAVGWYNYLEMPNYTNVEIPTKLKQILSMTEAPSASAIAWCRKNAPEAIKDVADEDLWEYMKDSYESMHTSDYKCTSEIEGIVITMTESEDDFKLSFSRVGTTSEIGFYLIDKRDFGKSLDEYSIEDLGSGTDDAGNTYLAFAIIEEDNDADMPYAMEHEVMIDVGDNWSKAYEPWHNDEHSYYRVYSPEKQKFVLYDQV